MTETAKIKQQLEAKLKVLTARAEEIDDDLSQLGDDDSNESAIESEDDEVLEQVGGLAISEISQIKTALRQIDAGKYGVCTSCGNAIKKERLEALPYATKCVKCS